MLIYVLRSVWDLGGFACRTGACALRPNSRLRSRSLFMRYGGPGGSDPGFMCWGGRQQVDKAPCPVFGSRLGFVRSKLAFSSFGHHIVPLVCIYYQIALFVHDYARWMA